MGGTDFIWGDTGSSKALAAHRPVVLRSGGEGEVEVHLHQVKAGICILR